jgi:hypothetical protein
MWWVPLEIRKLIRNMSLAKSGFYEPGRISASSRALERNNLLNADQSSTRTSTTRQSITRFASARKPYSVSDKDSPGKDGPSSLSGTVKIS